MHWQKLAVENWPACVPHSSCGGRSRTNGLQSPVQCGYGCSAQKWWCACGADSSVSSGKPPQGKNGTAGTAKQTC